MGRASNREDLKRREAEEVAQRGEQTATFQVTQFQSQSVTYHSFLPPAEELQALEDLCSGLTERYMTLGEQEAVHRRRMQSRALWFNGINSTLGVLFAGTIGLSAVVGGLWAAAQGFVTDWQGIALAIGAIASLAGTFIWGRRSTQRK